MERAQLENGVNQVAGILNGLHISGRRWFQRSFGNTYHTVSIFDNGECIHISPKTYGYGDQYLQTALAWLTDNGYPQCAGQNGTLFIRETLGGTWSVADVARERDL